MADYFTQFSCLLDLKTPENLNKALELYDSLDELEFEASAPLDYPNQLWLRAENYGDPDEVITFVMLIAKACNLTGLWGFQYAQTYSKARLDSFGGGAVVMDLTTRTATTITTTDWLRHEMSHP